MVGRCFLVLFLIVISGANAQVKPVEGIRKINGTSLYVRVIGKGTPIVVVHGGPGMNHTYFLPGLEVLAKKYQLIFFDQRASGRSAIPHTDSLSLSFFVDDIEAIRNEFHLAKINLLAHSWGAIPAVEYAVRYPAYLNRLILCNPVPLSTEFNQQMAAVQMKRMNKQDSLDRAQVTSSSAFKSGDSEAYRKLLMISFRHSFMKPANYNKLRYEMPANFVRASRALFTGLGNDLSQYDYYEDIRGCKIPVLIIHGTADVIPLAAIQKMKDNFPNAALSIYKSSGHFTFIEEPEKFRKDITGFLALKK